MESSGIAPDFASRANVFFGKQPFRQNFYEERDIPLECRWLQKVGPEFSGKNPQPATNRPQWNRKFLASAG
jgi:hypothetical protein